MSKKEGRDYLYLIWKDSQTRKNYIVGELSKNGQYEFRYTREVNEAINAGFDLLISFDELGKTYTNDTLFPTFSSRLPDKKRRDLDKILKKYNLDTFDEYALLKKSGARLPIDTLEFIDPIFLNNGEENIDRFFYVAGVRHYLGCSGDECYMAIDINPSDDLYLELEPSNEYDNKAVKILNINNEHIGYLPRYYSESVVELLKEGFKYKLIVVDVNKDKDCSECIKVKINFFNKK